MAGPALTHAQMAVKLVVDGALRIAQGKLPEKMPVEAVPLTDEEKKKASAAPHALAVFYPVGETGVFMQMHGNHVRVWYTDIDCDGVVEMLEKAIHQAHPSATFKDEQPHLSAPGLNVRLYHVPIDSTHFANVEATFPIDRRVRQQFVVRVHAMEET